MCWGWRDRGNGRQGLHQHLSCVKTKLYFRQCDEFQQTYDNSCTTFLNYMTSKGNTIEYKSLAGNWSLTSTFFHSEFSGSLYISYFFYLQKMLTVSLCNIWQTNILKLCNIYPGTGHSLSLNNGHWHRHIMYSKLNFITKNSNQQFQRRGDYLHQDAREAQPCYATKIHFVQS